MADITLNLNDFRSVLGNVNDGNIVFKQDGSGIEKANYGNKFLNLFRTTRTAENSAAENQQVRSMLLRAILNSAEGKVLDSDTMKRIYVALGMTELLNPEDLSKPLSRRELKNAIDIIDEATKGNTLIKANTAALKSAKLWNESVMKNVAKAIDNSAFLQKGGKPEDRIAMAKGIFGQDFRGRSPAEMDKFVRNNYAVIREQVFDRLYWSNPMLAGLDNVLNAGLDAGLFNEFGEISPDAMKATFKEVVGDLMTKYAAGEVVTTKLETLAPTSKGAGFVDANAKDVWKVVINGPKITATINSIMTAPANNTENAVGVGTFNSLQLKRAAEAVNNLFITTFNQLYAEKGFNTQETEKAFSAKMDPLMRVLDEINADLKAIGGEAAGKIRAKLADEIGKMVFTNAIKNEGKLADAVIKALDNVVKSFSARHIVEDFANANYGYLKDKSPVVEFFMEKISNAGKEDGIANDQRTALSNYQKAVLAGSGDTARQQLEISLLTPLSTAYNDMVAQSNPDKVKEMRVTRNNAAYEKLVDADQEYSKNLATMIDEGKSAQEINKLKAARIIQLKINTLIAMSSFENAYALGVTEKGSSRILTVEVEETNPDTGETRMVNKPDPQALAKLDEQLLALNDKDFEFFSQYSAKGMGMADINLNNIGEQLAHVKCDNTFQNALRDGTISISSVPTNAVKVLENMISVQLLATSNIDSDVTIKSLLPSIDNETDAKLVKTLVSRFVDRFAASGVKPIPPALKEIAPNENAASISDRLLNKKKDNFLLVRGFGTIDLSRILKLFNEVGLSLAPLGGKSVDAHVDFFEKIMCLSTIAAMNAFKLDGIPEFTERVIGKPFSEVTYTDVLKALSKFKMVQTNSKNTSTYLWKDNIAITDPLSKLTGSAKTVKELFAGETQLSNAALSTEETTNLLSKVRELDAGVPGVTKTVNIKLKGVDVELTRLAGGELRVKTNNMPFRSAFDANGIKRMLENEIASKPGSFDAALVKSALPSIDDVKSGKVPLVRARELYAKTIASKTGSLPVMFSAYTTEQLREIALKAVDGQFTANDIPKNPPATYNSGAMIEMHTALSLTSSAEINAKVKINVPEGKSITLRKNVPPDPQSVRNVIADLFLNKDTWEFDASVTGKAQPGERIRKLLVEHAPELSFILKGLDGNGGLDLLSSLPVGIRDAVKSVLGDIAKINITGLADAKKVSNETKEALATIETKIDGIVTTLIDSLQEKVTALFETKDEAGDVKAPWQKTFAELNGKDGIDTSTKQGKFTMTVLQNYFKESALVDKRAMLSAFIRNTDANSSDAKQVAELLKGAGPLLQKMLQGLPLSSFNAETQLALKDMKSRLLPIPDEAVKAQMLELVRSSNGEILSIEVKKSLGAASVGQAFLCTIKTKNHPYMGEECVVKLLRPNVDTAIQREKALIDKLIANDQAMTATFDGQYRKILEEFDLTLESTNVGIGTTVYERPQGVETIHTMQMFGGTQSTMTSMIIKKAEGTTFDATIDSIRGTAEGILAPFKQTTVLDGKTKTVYKAPSADESAVARRKLMAEVAKLEDRRNHILDITRVWFDNAIFGNGFFHGDLHGGNLMTGPTGTTFIDFGNCSRLSKNDQDALKMMFATTIAGETKHFISNFLKLMPDEAQASFKAKFPEDSQAMDGLVDILKRGNASDLMLRLQAFISAVQSEDVPIPPALQNFVQSYMRLNDIVVEIDKTIEDIHIAAASIYYDMPEVEPVENDPPFFAGVRKLARAFVGTANAPYSEEGVCSARDDVNAYLNTQAGKAEITANTHNIDWVLDTLKPFIDDIANVSSCRCTSLELVGAGSLPGRAVGIIRVQDSIAELQKLKDDGKLLSKETNAASEEATAAFNKLEHNVREMASLMVTDFVAQMRTRNSNGRSTFGSIPTMIDMSMTDVCSNVILRKQDTLQGLVIDEFGYLKAIPFATTLLSNFDSGKAAAARRKATGPLLSEQNRKLPAEERISANDLVTISRATDTFLVQSPRPDANAGWCSDKAKRTDLLVAIGYNISRAATALKLGEGERLSAAAVRHATLNFALPDEKLVQSILSLSKQDYDTLLADANAIDQNNGGHELATALAALRNAAPLMQTVSQAGLAAID